MTIIINCVVYVALIYEGFGAFLTLLQMVNFSKTMQYDMTDIMIQVESFGKLLNFGILTLGVIARYRSMVKVWLLLSYCQINWGGVVKLFVNIYEYFFAEKYKDKAELIKELSESHGQLVGQVLTQIGTILIVYRFFQSLEPPRKIRGPLTAMPTEKDQGIEEIN